METLIEVNKKEEKGILNKEIILLGTNLQPNKEDKMQHNLELYPFVKQRNIKTLIPPLIKNRLSEAFEKERLISEKI